MSDRQFVIIPYRALDMALEGKHIKTLCVLGGHTNKYGLAKVRQSTIAKIMGVSRRSVNEYIGVLADNGLVQKTYTKRDDGGNGAIEYRLIFDTPPVTPDLHTPCNPQTVTPPTQHGVTALTSLTEYSNGGKDIPKGISKIRPVLALVYEAWNGIAEQHGLSKVRTELPSPNRDKTVIARLKDCGGDEGLLLLAISKVPLNPFWIGKGEKIWRADFDWLFKSAANFRKALEFTPPKDNTDVTANQNRPANGSRQSIGEQRSRRHDRAAQDALALLQSGEII